VGRKDKKSFILIKTNKTQFTLTGAIFETGAMPVPTKSRNPTICG
jgi:hypothetical protein